MRKAIFYGFLMIFISIPISLLSQTRTVTGKVSGLNGISVPLATVHQKNTNTSVTADENGSYSILVTGGNPILIFSSVNFLTQEVAVGNRSVVDVQLQSSGALSEVVVTALGISRQEQSLGYATQEVKGSDLTTARDQNVLGSLAGKVAGVQISGSSAASMGGTEKIQIRGVNSVTGGGEPLIVVDNVPISNSNFAARSGRDYGNLAQDINPEDIESVNVLKGPAASALYGLRGQYGVILITTKKGHRNQKPSVTLNSGFTFDRTGNFMPLQNLYGAGSSLNFPTIEINGVETKYVDGSWDESWGPKMDGTPVRQQYSFYPADPDFGKMTPFIPHPDNVKDYFVTGHTVNNNISFTGGGDDATFRLSFNHTDIKGTEPNTMLKRNNLSFSGSLNVTSNLVLSTNLNFANNRARRPSQGYYTGSRYFNQWFERNLDMQKLKQYKYPDGTFYQWNLNDPDDRGIYEDMQPIDWNNPYFEAYENISHDSRDRFFGNILLAYTILPGLQVSGMVMQDGYTQNIDERSAFGGRDIPSFSIGKYESKEMNYQFMAQYDKTFNKFSINANLGGNILKQNYTYLYEKTAGGLVSPGWYNISNSLERPIADNFLREKEVRSAFGTATLGYDNTYFLDLSLRRDISSALPPNNNSYFYPSAAASFVFSKLMNWEPLNFGKLRLSYAQAGSDIAPYQTTNFFGLGDPYQTSYPMFVPNNLNNPNLKPSVGTAYEAGLDLKFLQSRLGINFTWYHQRNKDAVLPIDVPGASGFTSYVINAGIIQNKGEELTINAIPLKFKELSWSTVFNASRNSSKIISLYSGLNSLILDQNRYSSVDMFLLANVGQAFGTIVGNSYQRDPATGKILVGNNGLPLWESNHDFGSVLPNYTGGWQNTFIWKNFSLTASIDFQSGGKFFSWTQMLSVKSGQHAMTAEMNDKGKNVRDPLDDGGGVKVTGISQSTHQEVTNYVNARTYYRNTIGTRIYDPWLIDASYIKMREINFGYTFFKEKYASLPVKSINIAFICRNPFMIYQKAPKGLNPDQLATGASSLNWLETGQLATVRSYGLNLNIGF